MQFSLEVLALLGTAQGAAVDVSRRSSTSSTGSTSSSVSRQGSVVQLEHADTGFAFFEPVKRQLKVLKAMGRPNRIVTSTADQRVPAITTTAAQARPPATTTSRSSSSSASSRSSSSSSKISSSSSTVRTSTTESASSSRPTTTSIKTTTLSSSSPSSISTSSPVSSTVLVSSSSPKPSSTSSLATTQSSTIPTTSPRPSTTLRASSSTAAASIATLEAVPSVAPSLTLSVAGPLSTTLIDWGCWQDSASARTFTGASYTSTNNMTIQNCASFCSAKNMPFSGTEYASECHCSAAAPTAAQAWWCNMPCNGNSNEICGSGNALSVYYAAVQDTSAGFKDLGCFADSASQRTLPGPSYSSSKMTNSACSAFCNAQGYDVSGTEYGSECYCSKALPWSAPVGCRMPCAGDATTVCGDGNALSVRVRGDSPLLASMPSATNTSTPLSFPTKIDLLQKFDSWKTWKARGTNLGNWLVLERWMDTNWFDSASGHAGAVDEWTFCAKLGKAACATALQQHWANWVTASDIAQLAAASINTLRIPVGYWAFIDPIAGEPYVKSTQLQEIARVVGLARQYGMTVTLDLHGLPGSQNGKDHSGHIGEVGWWTAANQQRSLDTIQAVATWIAAQGFAGTISALEVANEPDLTSWTQWLQYKDFVIASHAIIQRTSPGVTTMFHDGFWPIAPWNQFFTASDNVVLDTHKYWAFAETSVDQALSDVCAYVGEFQAMHMPVVVGEFSLSIQTAAAAAQAAQFAQTFFETQMQAWTQAAGGILWAFKAVDWQGNQQLSWSTLGLIQSGLLGNADVWSLSQAKCASAA